MKRSYVDLDHGLRVAYREVGEGASVVLIHGHLTTLEDMSLALEAQLRPGRRLIFFDRPGCGQSIRRRGLDAGVARQAQHLWSALDALGVEQPVLVGHSFGATVAIAMALRRPAATGGVVAVAPIVAPEFRLEHLLFTPRALPGSELGLISAGRRLGDLGLLPLLWRAMYLPQAVPEAVLERFPFALAGDDAAIRFVGEDSTAAAADLAGLLLQAPWCAAPVTILGGDADLVVDNRRHGALLEALMPKARLQICPGLGHMLHHFASERIARAVEDLEASAAPPSPAVRGG